MTAPFKYEDCKPWADGYRRAVAWDGSVWCITYTEGAGSFSLQGFKDCRDKTQNWTSAGAWLGNGDNHPLDLVAPAVEPASTTPERAGGADHVGDVNNLITPERADAEPIDDDVTPEAIAELRAAAGDMSRFKPVAEPVVSDAEVEAAQEALDEHWGSFHRVRHMLQAAARVRALQQGGKA